MECSPYTLLSGGRIADNGVGSTQDGLCQGVQDCRVNKYVARPVSGSPRCPTNVAECRRRRTVSPRGEKEEPGTEQRDELPVTCMRLFERSSSWSLVLRRSSDASWAASLAVRRLSPRRSSRTELFDLSDITGTNTL